MRSYRHFGTAINDAFTEMRNNGQRRERGKWQGVDVSQKPEMGTYELLHWGMMVYLYGIEDLAVHRRTIEPNLPWADDHFEERVSGEPLNPGEEWARWPWGKNADKFRMDPSKVGDPGSRPVFDHTYMQRYWPRYAGMTDGGKIQSLLQPRRGIYFEYGDLDGVVEELHQDPTTRQAVLPVFFPEDTGYQPGRRKPCSLHYWWILEDDKLDISYYLRSCDLIRHFRDDIYLTLRLHLWMIDRLRVKNPDFWNKIKPGRFVMMIGNLHCFVNDYIQLKGKTT